MFDKFEKNQKGFISNMYFIIINTSFNKYLQKIFNYSIKTKFSISKLFLLIKVFKNKQYHFNAKLV